MRGELTPVGVVDLQAPRGGGPIGVVRDRTIALVRRSARAYNVLISWIGRACLAQTFWAACCNWMLPSPVPLMDFEYLVAVAAGPLTMTAWGT